MKTNKILTVTLAAVLNLGGLATTPSLAAETSPPAQPLRQRIFQRIADKLNLTDDQKAQIKTILSGERGTLQPLLSRLHDARKNLRAAIRASDASEAAVRAASAQVADVEADLAVERMKIFGKIAPILTDEQRRKIADLEQNADATADSAIAQLGERSGD